MVVKWALSWACWNCSYLAASCLQWARGDWYVKGDLSCKWIKSLASWYLTACCSIIILVISLTSSLGNLHLLTRLLILLQRVFISSSGSWWRSDRSWFWWCQKWMSSLITDWIALRARAEVCCTTGEMVWLSIRVWRAWQSSPSNTIFICLQPFLSWSSTSGSKSRALV